MRNTVKNMFNSFTKTIPTLVCFQNIPLFCFLRRPSPPRRLATFPQSPNSLNKLNQNKKKPVHATKPTYLLSGRLLFLRWPNSQNKEQQQKRNKKRPSAILDMRWTRRNAFIFGRGGGNVLFSKNIADRQPFAFLHPPTWAHGTRRVWLASHAA